jgi:hypothetical protein
MLLGTLVLIAAYGNHVVPHGDELYLFGGKYGLDVKQYADDLKTPTPSLTPGWVWEQHAEHRIPLAKFVWLAVLKLTNFDFFVGNVLVVLSFGAVAAVMLLTVKAIRGSTTFADAFLPLSILNFSQSMDYLWWFCIHHVLPSLLASAVLIIIISKGPRYEFRHALAIAVCLLLLSLSGPGAFPFVLAFAIWTGYWSISTYRTEEGLEKRWHRRVVVGMVTLAVLLMCSTFIGFDRRQGMLSGYSADLRATVSASLQLVSISLGTATQYHFLWRYAGGGVVALAFCSLALLVAVWHKRREERLRASGLFLFLTATGVLIGAMALARGGMPEGYIFVGQYVPRIVPALCCIYFVFVVYGGRPAGAIMPMVLFTFACVLAWPNVTTGLNWAASFRYRDDLERDLRAGLPPLILAERYGRQLGNDNAETIAAVLDKMRRDKIGEFRNMRPDPTFREVPVPIKPISVNQLSWEDGVGYAKGNDPFVTFALRRPEDVYAIRIKLSYVRTRGQPPLLKVFWKQNGKNDFGGGGRVSSTHVEASSQSRTVTAWVDDTIDEIRIQPDIAPCVFTISDLQLLVPETR